MVYGQIKQNLESHFHIEATEDIDEICPLLDDTLPSSQSTMTPLLEAIAPAKRQSVPSISDGKGKIIKLHEFKDNTIIPLEVKTKWMQTNSLYHHDQHHRRRYFWDPFKILGGRKSYLSTSLQ